MSDAQHGHDEHGHGGGHHERWYQEPDNANLKKVLFIGGLALAAFVISVWAATWELRSVEREQLAGAPQVMPAKTGNPEIGIVNQLGFEIDVRTQALLADKHKELSSYGWVDRKAGTIRVPIDVAMQRVVNGEMPK